MVANFRDIVQHRPFTRFWVGFTVSVLGDAMTQAALTWHVYDRTGSAAAVGGLLVAMTGPVIVGGLIAGWLLDRFDRRQVMLIDSLIRGVAVASVPLADALGLLTLGQLYLVAGVYGLLFMVSLAGGPALVPSLVPPERLTTANALETLSFTLGGVIGPPLAGLVILGLGAPVVLGIDALTYAFFALVLATLPTVGRSTPAAGSGGAHRLDEVGRLVIGQPILLATTIMYAAFNIGGTGMLAVWLPLLADQTLNGGAGLYGSLLGAIALGQVVGTLLAGGRRWRRPLGALICLALVLAGLALLPLLAWPTLITAFVGLVLFGVCGAPLTIWAQTLRMRIIPEHLRGRTFALLRMAMQSGTPVGGVIAGSLVPLVGLSAVIGLSVLLVGLPGLLGWRVTALRESETD